MSSPALDVVLVLAFVLLGGYFAASEIALVNLREGQVRRLERRSRAGRRVARLREDPNRMLSAVQVGVTLSGFFASAYGGATLAGALEGPLADAGLPEAAVTTAALVVVTLLVSYASLVLGELVPKRLALQKSEGVSLAVAPVLDRVATATRPVIWLLGRSTDLVGRLVGLKPGADDDSMSEEELREAVSSHESLEPEERSLLADVFEATDRRVSEVMVPRTEVAFLDGRTTVADAVGVVLEKPWSRYPVTREGSTDDVLGLVHVRDLLQALHEGRGHQTVGELSRDMQVLPGTVPALNALTTMREARAHLALVLDEYGGTDGVVALEDLVEELVGEIEDEFDLQPQRPAPEADGELEGLLHREEVLDRIGVELPEGPFDTLGGFVQAELGAAPEVGNSVVALDRRFTVTALDGRRIDRVRVERLPDDEGPPDGDDQSGRPRQDEGPQAPG